MVWEDEICNNYTKIYNLLKIERCGVKGPLSVPVHFDGAHSVCILEFARTSLFTPMVVAVLTVLPEDVFNEFCCSELSICTQIEEGLRLSAYGAHLEFLGFAFWV